MKILKYPKENQFTSISSYIDICSNIAKKFGKPVWYRGQGTHRTLIPGLYRHLTPVSDGRGNPVGKDFKSNSSGTSYKYLEFMPMLEVFKRHAIPFVQVRPTDDFEWMFIMQHYGLPTRLLDWSTDPLVALYFACGGSNFHKTNLPEENGDDEAAEIWIINPTSLNRESSGCDGIINLNESEWGDYINPEKALFPICVNASHIDARIIAQQGVFTLHGKLILPLNSYDSFHPHIFRLYVLKKHINNIKDNLFRLGYDHARMFPGIETLAQKIKEEELNKYVQWKSSQPTMKQLSKTDHIK